MRIHNPNTVKTSTSSNSSVKVSYGSEESSGSWLSSLFYLGVPTIITFAWQPASFWSAVAIWFGCFFGLSIVALLLAVIVGVVIMHATMSKMDAVAKTPDQTPLYHVDKGLLGHLTQAYRAIYPERKISDLAMRDLYLRHDHVAEGFVEDPNVLEVHRVSNAPDTEWAPEAKQIATASLEVAADWYARRLDTFEQSRLEDLQIEAAKAEEERKLKADGEVQAMQDAASKIDELFAA